MNASLNTQREELLHYIETADDKKINAFYTILEKEIKEKAGIVYTKELKTELDKRYDGYKSGKTKMITPTESKKRINKILKAKFGK
ncbi:MAG: hypothetical protein U0T69_08530 [Chitinophagales bacterium]